MKIQKVLLLIWIGLTIILLAACAGQAGPAGPEGPQGPEGPAGPTGPAGPAATDGGGLSEEQAQALEFAGSLQGIQFPALDETRRGCPACHVLVDPETGQYTLPYEGVERSEVRGGEHPLVAPDGTSLAPTEEANVTACLQCHAAGVDDRAGMGVMAPLALRDIVHPAHMFSQWFKLHYGGNCFVCHNVDGEGNWELLTEMVDVNDKGVPNPYLLPIPGAIKIGADPAVDRLNAVVRGGKLYDKWWKVVGLAEPEGDQPLWATQDTNTRSGGDTWRCKECHGWDYQGADGAYGSGSHFTGFPGVLGAQTKTTDELVAALTGGLSPDHDFSAMGDAAIGDLALFLQAGLVDVSPFIDADSKAAVGGDAELGEQFYAVCVFCHGEDGRMLNFGSDDDPEYVGTIAVDNPWEFIHKVRFGQPGTSMPAMFATSYDFDAIVSLLAFSQSLPLDPP